MDAMASCHPISSLRRRFDGALSGLLVCMRPAQARLPPFGRDSTVIYTDLAELVLARSTPSRSSDRYPGYGVVDLVGNISIHPGGTVVTRHWLCTERTCGEMQHAG